MTARMSWRAFTLAATPLILAAPSVVTGLLPDAAALVVIAWAAVVIAFTARPESSP